MDKEKAIKRAESIIKAMEFIKANYDVLTDENVPLETITATERLLETMWDELSDKEMTAIANIVGLNW